MQSPPLDTGFLAIILQVLGQRRQVLDEGCNARGRRRNVVNDPSLAFLSPENRKKFSASAGNLGEVLVKRWSKPGRWGGSTGRGRR